MPWTAPAGAGYIDATSGFSAALPIINTEFAELTGIS